MLVIQDIQTSPVSHINNWGTKLYRSNNNNIYFNIGKYTRLVMKDIGFELLR